jgi:tetratricopeptide (TPR) repeat protein
MGVVYEQSKKFDSANLYYSQAYVLSEKMGDDKAMANILNNQGTLYRDRGDIPSAHTFYHKALRLRKAKKNKLGMTRSFNNLGQFYVETVKNDDSAVFYLKQAINLGTEIGYWQTVSSSTKLLYKLYRQKEKYKDAYETLVLNRQVNDSLFNVESSRKIAQLEMQFEFDRQQSLLQAKQKEKELYAWMGGGALTFLLIIVTLLFFLQRSKTKRSELEQAHLQLERINLKNDLAIKDKELAANIMYLLNKNELINSMSEKLLDIKTQLSAENQPAIQKVVLDLQSNLQPELWQEFDFRFQQVHEQFYKVLNERFPDLSPSDRRLCAFLKLNMTTKEISAITHQNAKSIDVARTRLRKKLNLTGTDHNLVSFLLHLDNSDSANPS